MAKSHNIKVILSNGNPFIAKDAHGSTITSFEMTQYKGTTVLFSGGLDFRLKAWTIDQQANCLTQVDMKDVGKPINCLQMVNSEFVIAGSNNGEFIGWNLASDSIDSLPAHDHSITQIVKK